MCDWHPLHGPLRRRERFLLALQAPCPECQAPTHSYCLAHGPGRQPLRVKVHHARAALAEELGCRCHSDNDNDNDVTQAPAGAGARLATDV